MSIPAFGVGTFRLKGQSATDSVRQALQLGYRAVDTAQIYDNEQDVGQALREAGVPREQLFLTTKIWTANLGRDALLPSLHDSLAKLGTDHVDLTLIHWPAAADGVPLEETLDALVAARSAGLTRQIGVSNFNIALSQRAIDHLGAAEIACNQIELSPYLQNRRLVQYLRAQSIPVTSYMTLAYGKVLQDALLLELAPQYDATPAQIALAWALQHGFAVIPSSTQRAHLASNLAAQTLRLSAADMARIDALERGGREVNPAGLAPQWDD